MGVEVSVQRISNWILNCAKLCYDTSKVEHYSVVRAHSTRSQATAIASLHNVSTSIICPEAAWSLTQHCDIPEACPADPLLPAGLRVWL